MEVYHSNVERPDSCVSAWLKLSQCSHCILYDTLPSFTSSALGLDDTVGNFEVSKC